LMLNRSINQPINQSISRNSIIPTDHHPTSIPHSKGLPFVLDRLLGYSASLDVQADAAVTTRLALAYSGAQASVDALVGDGHVLAHAVRMVEGAMADVMPVASAEEGAKGKKGRKGKNRGAEEEAQQHQQQQQQQQQQQRGIVLLKSGLALASDALRADPSILRPHLSPLFHALAAVISAPPLAPARTQAMACLLSALLHVPRAMLVGEGLLTSQLGAGLGALLQHPALASRVEGGGGAGDENSTTTLAMLAADAVSLLATRVVSSTTSEEAAKAEAHEDPAWRLLTQPETLPVFSLLTRHICLLATDPSLYRSSSSSSSSSSSRGSSNKYLPVARCAVLALQALLWARPTIAPQLLADTALRRALARLMGKMEEEGEGMEQRAFLDFAYLHTVLEEAPEEEEEEGAIDACLRAAPIRTADWLEHVGLQRSAVQSACMRVCVACDVVSCLRLWLGGGIGRTSFRFKPPSARIQTHHATHNTPQRNATQQPWCRSGCWPTSTCAGSPAALPRARRWHRATAWCA
jgi:hypothetical protein